MVASLDLVQVKNDVLTVAGRQRDAGALFEVIAVEVLTRLEAERSSFETGLFGGQGVHTLLERALLRLKVDVGD